MGILKDTLKKKINSNQKNNEKHKRELYETNDDLFKKEINKNHIEYGKPDIINNEINKINDNKFINLVSENQSILKKLKIK